MAIPPIGKSPAAALRAGRGGLGGGRFAPAWGAEVVSSNIVGYEKVNLTDKTYKMGGVQFVGVGDKDVNLNDLFTGEIEYGTQIMFLDMTTGAYVTYKYLEEAYDEDLDDFVPGWADGKENIAVDPVDAGSGFWFFPASGDTTVTQSGQVSSEKNVSISVPAGQYTMVINPFPEGFNPNKVSWNADLAYGTQIMILGPTGAYVSYKYLEEAYDEATDDFIPGWADGKENIVTDDIVGVGEGFWVLAPEGATITFTSPIAE